MGNDNIDSAKENIMQSIHHLMQIAVQQNHGNFFRKLKVQEHVLAGLDERIERSMLPEGFVRSFINDVRLDVLMILADIKLHLTFEKQEATAPTDKLQREACQRLSDTDGDDTKSENNKHRVGRELSAIEKDLQMLANAERLLNESLL